MPTTQPSPCERGHTIKPKSQKRLLQYHLTSLFMKTRTPHIVLASWPHIAIISDCGSFLYQNYIISLLFVHTFHTQ